MATVKNVSAGILLGVALLGATASAQPADPAASAPKSEIDRARDNMIAAKRNKVYYDTKFDLSGLPPYQPQQAVSGTIRMWGANYLTDSPLAERWAAEFQKWQPDVKFDFNLRSSQHAISSLIFGTSDISPLGRSITNAERLAFQREFQYQPLGIIAVTGSLTLSGWNPAVAIFVNKDNPLAKLSMEQLDGIFGSQRTGGWNDITWDPSVARGPERNIRTWGQLGLTGEWTNKPIRVLGYNLKYNFPDEIHNKVFHGGYKWNEALEEYANKANPDGSLYLAVDQMVADIAKNPDAIAYGSGGLANLPPNVKVIPLSMTAGDAPVMPTLETVQNRTYPMSAEVFFFINRKPGTPVDPKVKEFMRYVLSREGQAQVMKDGKYLPLTPELDKEQLEKMQ